jgi:hypothetical protein
MAGNSITFSYYVFQSGSDLFYQNVTDTMSERVIYTLKIINIKKHDSNKIVVMLRMFQGLSQSVLKERTVGKTGQGIVVSHAVNIIFSAFSLNGITNGPFQKAGIDLTLYQII